MKSRPLHGLAEEAVGSGIYLGAGLGGRAFTGPSGPSSCSAPPVGKDIVPGHTQYPALVRSCRDHLDEA